MKEVLLLDILIFSLSVYTALFIKKFKSEYPDMTIGIHMQEICHNMDTWNYGNDLFAKTSLIVSTLFFLIIIPISLIFNLDLIFYIILILALLFVYIVFIFAFVKLKIRKKFNLKKKK